MSVNPLQRRMSSPLWRLYHISLMSAFALTLPLLLVLGYYGYRVVSTHYRYNAAVGVDEPLTAELFHIHLHDLITQDIKRVAMPDGPKDTPLPSLELFLGNGELAQLDANLPPGEGKGEYVTGYLQKGSRTYDVKARYRGRKHWHWNYPQKSWKIRLQTGQFFEGRDTLGILNTVSPLPFSEQIVLDIAREEGLLTPDYYPIRLRLNGAPMGVHFLQTQPDEGLIRNSKRIPGGLFSGSKAAVDPATGVSSLWQDVAHWKKVATSQTEKLKDFHRLEALLAVVKDGDQVEFARFARQHVDLETFALLDALDVIFGNDQHDFHQDHKFYFDPYKGRFEPIAWGFGRWRNPNRLNRTENPLLLRLKELPEYRVMRNAQVMRLLQGPCSVTAIRERAAALFARLRTDQLTDPFWDAYRLLPGLGRYYRQMVRPMDVDRQATVFESLMERYGRRVAYLTNELQGALPTVVWKPSTATWPATLEITVDGQAGYRLDGVHVRSAGQCKEVVRPVRLDRNLSGQPESDEPLLVNYRPDLLAATVQEARNVHPFRGPVRAVTAPQTYRFFIEGDCPVAQVDVLATNLLTGDVVRVAGTQGELSSEAEGCSVDYTMAPGQRARHPWCEPPTSASDVVWGPGEVQVREDRVFGPDTTVRILPGTTVRLDKKVSVVFLGLVLAEGTADEPIVFTERKKRFGGIVVQGPGTQGSRFRHVTFEKGRHAEYGLGLYPGMVNIHDTRDIILDHCQFKRAKDADDVLHIAYVKKLSLEHLSIIDAQFDALDVEFSKGIISHLTVTGAGDECLDLMGSKLNVRDSRFIDCGGSAISAGEETRINLVDSILSGGRTGLLVKNASRAVVDGTFFHDLDVAVEVTVVSDRYEKRSKLKASELIVEGCGEALKSDKPLKRMPAVRAADESEQALFGEGGEP